MRIEDVIGKASEKRRWRAAKTRLDTLPAPYREAASAVEHYLLHQGSIDDDKWTTAFEDLADLFERAAADGTPVRDLLGEDPTQFIETFAANYINETDRTRAQRRLLDTIDRASVGSGPLP